jgi:alanyl-tRNA synthetase
MLEEEYQLDYFTSHGLERKICTSCGAAFWTRDPARTLCGDAPCEPYSFIGNPVFKPHSLNEMREAFLSFFERHDHTRIERYPVAARWRDDIYLTIASIADFQPFVTSGEVPPPANPLTISQPCIRLNDLDSVGRSGRHLTTFEMMAHHAFNNPDQEIYWKDRTVELCDEFISSIGGDLNAVSYKEHPWIGGGNAGPSVEVLISGLEVATLVFMSLGRTPTRDAPVDLDGVAYYPMRTRIVDTGYGLERFVWASTGSPTIYDAVFPEMVSRLMEAAGLSHFLDKPEYTKILAMNAKFAGLMDISGSNILTMRRQIASQINVPLEKLQKMITPIERVYAIADHTRCLAYMLGDCIVPSNAQEGYLARLVLRRTLRMMHELGIAEDPADLIEMQMRTIGIGSFEQDLRVVREIVANEVEKYGHTMDRGARIVQKMAREYKKKSERIPLAEMITLYDSHGIPPETVREVAAEEGAMVDLPDNFYSLIADVHSESSTERTEEDRFAAFQERLATLPPTKRLYYERPGEIEFEAIVLDHLDGYVVLDQTLLYPEGGGQPSDTGTLVTEENMVRIDHVFKLGDVILHQIKGGTLKRGERVKGMVDEERRWTMMRHHTGTHILLHAAREILGKHIHQAGAQKGIESSRLDIRHYRHITPDELKRIEIAANRMVLADMPVSVKWEERSRAEQKYGFDLYQGGVPPGSEIRVVSVCGDVQACAGTHCRSTGEIGPVKIIRVEHIQDGIERLEFAAGTAAIYYMQHVEQLLADASAVLSVQRENLPPAVERFFTEWKEQKKEIERLQQKCVSLEMNRLTAETVAGVPVAVHIIDATPKELVTLATKIADGGGIAVLAGGEERIHVVVSSGTDRVDARPVVQAICGMIGGRGGGKPFLAQGGGTERARLDEALEAARRALYSDLNE